MKLSRCFLLSVLASACMPAGYAAKPIDLRHQSIAILQSYVGANLTDSQSDLKESHRSTDFKHVTHIHLQQMLAGHPVWGADSIVHVPQGANVTLAELGSNQNATMNGLLYQAVEKDLGAVPVAAQADIVLQAAIKQYQSKAENRQQAISQSTATLIVFVDKANKAHWSYLVSFLAQSSKGLPAKPTLIMDAATLEVYQQWNNLQTLDEVAAGGNGGNAKEGMFSYDGKNHHYPKLTMLRDSSKKMCYLQNSEVVVQNCNANCSVVNVSQFGCEVPHPGHGFEFWNGTSEMANGGYNPANDALFIGKVVQEMYRKWYNVPALQDRQGNAMLLTMRVHASMENAYWDGTAMTFGDGYDTFYPLVSLGVGAHEISHGFTQQHSNLTYWAQSGGLNESFSDMAAQAAEFYANGFNSWQIGPEIMKQDGALRYMDEPTKDCNGMSPGSWCSIDNVKDYYEGLDVHFSSGVFNKAFYLMGSEHGWNNTRKAFDVMVKANQDYWTPNTTFAEAACGVLKATADYNYDVSVVKAAFANVGINDLDNC
jgi:pseudolysin